MFSGGFIGVDIFFVISGYLITSILLEDLEKKKFSFSKFFERRIRRIIPALFFVMFISSIIAWIILPDVSLNKFGDGLIGVSLFISNIVFWRQDGYFEDTSELNPLIHTWSLAVEEQYYILFPFFLLFFWKFGKKKILWAIIFLTIISFLLSEWGWRNKEIANFYLAPTRVWEIFSGSIAAFIISKNSIKKKNTLSLIGFVLIIISFLVYDDNTPFPSIYTLMPIIGTILILIYSDKNTLIGKLLSLNILVSIGLISYSLYLWHQPIFAFTRIFTNQINLENDTIIKLIPIIFALSYLSRKFVELPFLKILKINKKEIFALSFLSLVILFLIGWASKKVINNREYFLAKKLSENEFIYVANLNMDERKFIEGRLIYPLNKVETVIVGSSRVMQINSDLIGHKIQSLTVSGASIEENIAFGLEAIVKLKYKNIYIAADPWIINTLNSNEKEYKSIFNLYDYWLNIMQKNQTPSSYLSSTEKKNINFENNFLKKIRKNLLISENLIPKNDIVEPLAKKAYDGSHIYNEGYVNKKNKIDLNILNYKMKKFSYDKSSIKNLKMFISYLKDNNINVTLFLTPYHQTIYQAFKTKKPIFIEIENWFRNFAEENNIEIIGSYDPSYIGCLPDEFYDGMHPKSSCIKRVFLNKKD